MRMPRRPPSWDEVFGNDPSVLRLMRNAEVTNLVEMANEKYLHWDRFRHYPVPEGVQSELAWLLVDWSRQAAFRELPLEFEKGKPLKFWTPPCVAELLHTIDRDAGGFIGTGVQDRITHTEHERYLINSLMEEAIASSQLEGASTTREVAKKMLRTNRKPRTTHERMIVNNYRAILDIREYKNDPLTPSLIKHLQQVITEGTLEEEKYAGTFRDGSVPVCVVDSYTGDVLHNPPSHDDIERRIQQLCEFANRPPNSFVHPVIIAIALHFVLGYVHPFVDGNGRTARALFYWYMLRSGYWLFEFLPISRSVLNSPVKYGRAYLYTETDGGDLTYFIHYNLNVIKQAIGRTLDYVERKQAVFAQAKRLFSSMPDLNHRQIELAYEAVRDTASCFTVRQHMSSHGVSRNTARTDLQSLVEKGVLEMVKEGRTHMYVPAEHLRTHVMKGRIVPKEMPKGYIPVSSETTAEPGPDRLQDLKGQKSLFEE